MTATSPGPADLLPRSRATEDVRKTLGLVGGRRFRRWIRLGIALAVALALAAIVARYVRARAAASAPRWETAPVVRGDLRVTVAATGRLEGVDTVEVGAEVSGRVVRVHADFNQRVVKGALLAEIDPEQPRAAARQARAQAAAALASIREARATERQAALAAARAHALRSQSLATTEEVEAADASAARAVAALAGAQAQSVVAEAALSQAEWRVARTSIVAPIDGIVLARLVEPGQTVTAGFTTPVLFKLTADLSRMELYVDVDEADVGRVREGQEAGFTVDAYPGRVFASRVVSLHNEPTRSANVVTYQGVLEVDNGERLLRPGMTATATIAVETRRGVLLVPNAALRFAPRDASGKPAAPAAQERPGDRRVWVMEGGRPTPMAVRVGASDGANTELLGGIVEGRAVVVDTVEP